MATDFIRREAALDFLIPTDDLNISAQDQWAIGDRFEEFLKSIPAADVVTSEAFNRILIENDVMREQLAQIGKKPGYKMDDVRLVVRGRWIVVHDYDSYQLLQCDQCNSMMWNHEKETPNFCHGCGADMRPERMADND